MDDTELRRQQVSACYSRPRRVELNIVNSFDHLLDENTDPWKSALKETTSQHVRLVQLALSDYVHDLIPKTMENEKPVYRNTLFPVSAPSSTRTRANKVQGEQDIPRELFTRVSAMPSRKSKVKAVSRLIAIADSLLQMNNFFSYKQVMSGVKGKPWNLGLVVLTFKIIYTSLHFSIVLFSELALVVHNYRNASAVYFVW